MLQEADFEHLDPGNTYFALDYTRCSPRRGRCTRTSRTPPNRPRTWPPGCRKSPTDNKTVTVHLKEGIHFSPPVNREVTSEDVAYAIERGANPNVANPYFKTYFNPIEGMPNAEGGPIKGIETPNRHEIVFHLTEPKGHFLTEALVLPLTAPYRRNTRKSTTRASLSSYVNYQVATGPYMLKNNAAGKVLGIGYVPGKSATLVRNPNWSANTDFRPAYLNEIDINLGGTRP